MTEITETPEYEEIWMPPFSPLVFFLPMFYKYGVIISKAENDNENKNEHEHSNNDNDEMQITFGYGFSKPWDALSAKTVQLRDIDKDSITIGNASWKDNFLKYGGWGIRLGLDGSTGYNAKNGDYIEFEESSSGKSKKYRFVSNDVQTVASLMRGKSADSTSKE